MLSNPIGIAECWQNRKMVNAIIGWFSPMWIPFQIHKNGLHTYNFT